MQTSFSTKYSPRFKFYVIINHCEVLIDVTVFEMYEQIGAFIGRRCSEIYDLRFKKRLY